MTRHPLVGPVGITNFAGERRRGRPDGGEELDAKEPEPVEAVRTIETPLGRATVANGQVQIDRRLAAAGAVGLVGVGTALGMMIGGGQR